MNYSIVISELPDEEGGGYIGYVPDLRGCMSDGETYEEALANTISAIEDWISVAVELGREIPEPGSAAMRSKNDRDRLVETIKLLAEGYTGLDGRIETISKELQELRETLENEAKWHKFSLLSGEQLAIPGQKRVVAH